MSPLTAANQPCNLKKICALSTLLFITCISYSQSFFKLIASKQLNANYCRDIMQTNDGGYLLAGGSTLQTDDTYANAIRRAQQEGFGAPETYMADLVMSHVANDSDNCDYLFTPEVIAELDEISAEIAAGAKTYSLSELDEHLAADREAWLANHPH